MATTKEAVQLSSVEMGKAVYDLVMKRLPVSLDARLGVLGEEVAKGLRASLSAELKAMVREEMAELEKDYAATSAALEASHEKRLSEIRLEGKDYEAKFLGLLNDARATHQEGLAGMKGLMEKETGSAAWVGQMLKKELSEENARLTKSFENRSAALENEYRKSLEDHRAAWAADLKSASERLAAASGKGLEALRTEFHKGLGLETSERVTHFEAARKTLEESFDKRLSEVSGLLQKGLEGMQGVLKALPPPQVSVPDGAILVKMQAPVTHVAAPTVNVAAPAVPAQPAPHVTVNVPRRRVTKAIQYDDQNRPAIIHETEEPLEGEK